MKNTKLTYDNRICIDCYSPWNILKFGKLV
ncbi:hypothetical protein Gotri_019085 [Gossypium trilobum]|uniref:Uncharacterized protein n=1 Tax=Gossypium trilobum TaxID=34281 RepID=A0A7J9EC29_9ROSI|nr:hypothetical protein [Gossypium trilobum]